MALCVYALDTGVAVRKISKVRRCHSFSQGDAKVADLEVIEAGGDLTW